MKCVTKFDPIRDIQAVDQFGFIDLAKANSTGVVDVPIDVEEGKYNGIEDPRSIAGRPDDIFSAMQANKAILSFTVSDSTADAPKE